MVTMIGSLSKSFCLMCVFSKTQPLAVSMAVRSSLGKTAGALEKYIKKET